MNKGQAAFCFICFAVGAALPWTLIVVGGLISAFSTEAYWGETAAYMTAFGVIILAAVALLGGVLNRLADARR